MLRRPPASSSPACILNRSRESQIEIPASRHGETGHGCCESQEENRHAL
jgi:hypothetical protein